MTQIPAGWYPDPAQTHPARQRYWDGARWTEHIHDPEPVAPTYQVPPTYPSTPAYPPAPGYPTAPDYPEAAAYPQYQAYGQVAMTQRPTTPDGVPLSGWWWRVLAAILDVIISLPLYALAAVPVIVWQWDELSTWWSDLTDAIENNSPDPPDPALLDPTTGPGFVLILSFLVASTLYSVVFLRWKQATPGKLILGLRVRLRATHGRLPWSTILVRVGFVAAISVVAELPVPGIGLVGLVAIADYLWPLWDRNNQALHDKVARTNVIRPDRGQPTTAAGPPPSW